jgi:hypothetical protein
VFDYKHYIPDLITIDKNPHKEPDIVMDIETELPSDKADGVLCIGVTECCRNPFNLVKAVANMLTDNGKALFSIQLLNSNVTENDYWRFSIEGASKLLNEWFEIIDDKIIMSGHIAMGGVYLVGKKI